jgi:hypothetical protein
MTSRPAGVTPTTRRPSIHPRVRSFDSALLKPPLLAEYHAIRANDSLTRPALAASTELVIRTREACTPRLLRVRMSRAETTRAQGSPSWTVPSSGRRHRLARVWARRRLVAVRLTLRSAPSARSRRGSRGARALMGLCRAEVSRSARGLFGATMSSWGPWRSVGLPRGGRGASVDAHCRSRGLRGGLNRSGPKRRDVGDGP